MLTKVSKSKLICHDAKSLNCLLANASSASNWAVKGDPVAAYLARCSSISVQSHTSGLSTMHMRKPLATRCLPSSAHCKCETDTPSETEKTTFWYVIEMSPFSDNNQPWPQDCSYAKEGFSFTWCVSLFSLDGTPLS